MSQEVGLSEMMQRTFKSGGTQPQPALIAITLCLSVLAIVGIFGNILVVFFFYKGLRDLPQNVYVIALATLDTTVCAIVIPSTIYQDIWRGATTDLLCKGFHVLRCSLVTSSAFLLCLIAVDRFAIICFVPGIQTGRRKSVRLVGLTLLLGFAIGTPLGLTTGTRSTMIVRVWGGKTHSLPVTTAHCMADYSILPKMTVRIYKTCLTGLFLCMLLAIVFFYINILYFVRRRNRRWDKSRSYVSRVSVPIESKCGAETQRPDRQEESDAAGDVEGSCKVGGTCATVRFLNDKKCETAVGTELTRCVLETDIDQMLSEPAATSKAFNSCDVIASRGEEDACEPAPVEQRRMLGGQRSDSVTSNRLVKAQQHLSERSRKRPHIKTAKVLSIITFFYLLSYLPFFLVFHLQETGGEGNGGGRGGGSFEGLSTRLFSAINDSWGDYNTSPFANQTSDGRNQRDFLGSGPSMPWINKLSRGVNSSRGSSSSDQRGGGAARSVEGLFMQTVYYFYFINHGVNPIIYGCMNTYFKQQVYGMYNTLRLSCRGHGP